MEKIIDLHIHTNCSDGTLTPKEIIDEAYANGVSVIAIADHDTVEAYTDELFAYAKEKNIEIIKAVEVSTKANKAGVHVLGYNFDINNKILNEKLYAQRNARHIYLHEVGEKLNELGYVLNVEKLDKIDAVTKAHIAQDVVENEENKKLLLETFNHIPDKGEFIETIMNEDCPAYVKKASITPKEAAELIRQAGGKVVLAHPVAYKYEDGLNDEDTLNLVKEMNPDGLEAYYIYFDRNDNRIDEVNHWKEFAEANNLFVTIGSDFHKKNDPHSKSIGLIDDLKLDEETVENILKNILS